MGAMKSLVPVLLAALPAAAFAQMHLCTDATGRKTYSDLPCGPNAQRISVSPAAGGSSINPALAVTTEHYEIRGTTWEALRREIDSKGPQGWSGMASSRIGYEVKTRPDGAGCAVASVQARAETRVRLPTWGNRFEGPLPLQAHWDAVYRSLDLHERGHVAINVEGARDLERSLKEIPPQPTCEAVLAEAKRRAQLLWNGVAQRQSEYDRDTDHGRRQWSPYKD